MTVIRTSSARSSGIGEVLLERQPEERDPVRHGDPVRAVLGPRDALVEPVQAIVRAPGRSRGAGPRGLVVDDDRDLVEGARGTAAGSPPGRGRRARANGTWRVERWRADRAPRRRLGMAPPILGRVDAVSPDARRGATGVRRPRRAGRPDPLPRLGRTSGDARHDGLLLIHGLSATAWTWAPVARRLTASRHVVAMDLRGHGLSDARPTEGYDARTLAEDVRRGRRGFWALEDGGTGSSSPGTASARSLRRGPPRRSATPARASSSSTAAGSRSRRRPASTSTSSSAGSTSRPRSCARWRRFSRTARRSTRRRGTPTRSGPPGRPSSRRTRVGSSRRRGRTRSRRSVRAMFAYDPLATILAVEAPVVAVLAGDDEVGSRRRALSEVSVARQAAGKSAIAVTGSGRDGHNLMRYRPDLVCSAILSVGR